MSVSFKSCSWLMVLGLLMSCSSSRDKPEQSSPVADTLNAEQGSEGADVPVEENENVDRASIPAPEKPKDAKPSAKTPPKGEAVTAWSRLMAVNCDGKLAGIWTPIQAMIIRNAPRAIGNGPIQDTRVKNYFEQAHEGYDGTHRGLLNLDREVGRCMARMKGWEEVLRETTSWSLKEGVEGRLLQSVEAFHLLQEATKGAEAFPFGAVDSGVETNGRIWVKAFRKDCEPTIDGVPGNQMDPCLKLEMSCWSTGPCTGQVL